MKKVKLAALLLSGVMVMSSLVGCGGSNNAGTEGGAAQTNAGAETLKVWIPEEDMEFTRELCDQFLQDHPEYEFEIELAVVGIDESVEKVEADIDAAADVFTVPSGSLSQMTEAGLLYPITADEENVKALYAEAALEAGTRDGLLYGIPFSPNSWFMYYDKSLFTEEEVKNLDVMMAKDLGDDVYNFSCSITNSWYIEAFFYAAGCNLFGEDGMDPTQCDWNSEAGVAAANYVIDMANNPKYVEDKDGIALSLMKEGKLGACCTGTWGAPDIKEALGENYAACALPTITINGQECQLSNFADYKCFAVKSNTKYPLEAQLLAEYLSGEEAQLKRYEIAGATPTCLTLVDRPELAEDPAAVALMAQTEFATPQPSISQINNYWTPVAALGEGIYNKEITADNIQEKLDVVVNDILTGVTE